MSTPGEHGDKPAGGEPLDDLLLAQALDAAIQAERARPGSSDEVIDHAPAVTRAELRRMMALAKALDASVGAVGPSPEYRAAARERIMTAIGGPAAAADERRPMHLRSLPVARRRRHGHWFMRGSAGLLAGFVAAGATLTASASALPGDLLYGVKQAQEEVGVRLAADEQARVLAHLRRADARLDETARLLELGRTSDAVQTAQQYDQSIERATTSYALAADLGDSAATGHSERLEDALGQQQERLSAMLDAAPEPVQPELREALATTERGREMMADPRPVGRRAQGRTAAAAAVAATAVPTAAIAETPSVAVDDAPTAPPTAVPPIAVPPTATVAPGRPPTPVVVVAERDRDPASVARGRSGSERGGNDNPAAADDEARARSGPNRSGIGGDAAASVARRQSGPDGSDAPPQSPRVAQGSSAANNSSSANNSSANRGSGAARPSNQDRPRASGGADERGGPAARDEDRSDGAGDEHDDRPAEDDRGRAQNPEPPAVVARAPTAVPPTEARVPPSEARSSGRGSAESAVNTNAGSGANRAPSGNNRGGADDETSARSASSPQTPVVGAQSTQGDRSGRSVGSNGGGSPTPSRAVVATPRPAAPTATPTPRRGGSSGSGDQRPNDSRSSNSGPGNNDDRGGDATNS
jgi:hypothetical protein